MATRRCGLCGINYPAVQPSIYTPSSVLCPIHDEPMEYRPDEEPDDDWEVRATEITARVVQELDDGIPIPDLEPDALFEESGRTFIFSWDVVQRGVGHRLPDGSLLRVRDTTYEVMGYIDSMRAYWVIVFPMYLTDEQLADLATPPKKKRRKTAK